MNIQHIVSDSNDFESTIRALINDVAVLQYNNSTAPTPVPGLGERYDNMMSDLRQLDQQATRVRLGLIQAATQISRIALSMQNFAGVTTTRNDTEEAWTKPDEPQPAAPIEF